MVSDFITKANLFNNFFISRCSSVVNSSAPPKLSYKTKKRISDFEIKEDDIIQLCGKSNVEPLKYLFELFLTAGIFPEEWKTGNIIPVYKKESKNGLKNYRPISLLPIFSKIIERLIFNDLFKIFYSESNV